MGLLNWLWRRITGHCRWHEKDLHDLNGYLHWFCRYCSWCEQAVVMYPMKIEKVPTSETLFAKTPPKSLEISFYGDFTAEEMDLCLRYLSLVYAERKRTGQLTIETKE